MTASHPAPGAVAFPPPPPPLPARTVAAPLHVVPPAPIAAAPVKIGFGTPRAVPALQRLAGGRTASPSAYHPYLARLEIGGAPLEIELEPTLSDVAEQVRKLVNTITGHVGTFVATHPEYEFTVRTEAVTAGGPKSRIAIWRIPADPVARAARSAARIAALNTPEAIARREARKLAKARATV